ncbi:MAG: HAD family hydrolase [Mycobacteriaceae bacterium]
MSVLVCSDLDRTLIYSCAAAGPTDDVVLRCVEVYDGAPLSFVTAAAADGLVTLAEEATLVPTTTRSPEQYRRVQLPGRRPGFAITANGGRLLVDGTVDGDWSAHVAEGLAGTAPLGEVREKLGDAGDFLLRLRTAEDLFAYAVVDRSALPAAWVDELGAWCAERGWGVSVQGRKLYCVPDGLRKSTAAAEVARRAGTTTMLAAGDSLLDTDLLLAAAAAVRPAHGELHEAGFTAPHLAVTPSSGVRAGAEVVSWLLARASGH